jgi:Fic family protein
MLSQMTSDLILVLADPRIGVGVGVEGDYIHWDRLRYRTPPEPLNHDQWWLGIKIRRRSQMREMPLRDVSGRAFWYMLPDFIHERLHRIDQRAGGTIRVPEQVLTPENRDQYIVRALIEEAFTSSQIEGAGTTRAAAKRLIQGRRPPRDRGERMVLNNYQTMEHIHTLKDRDLSPEVLFEIHRLVTDGTLDDPAAAGRCRRPDETVVIADHTGETTYHVPPPADQLAGRLEALCDFANGRAPGTFVHPAIRSMILHFWLAYDHPFVDGNGRTARALFYWSMLRHDYWLFRFISISNPILKAPMKYQRAFLETETDDNDLTYFLLYHICLIDQAVLELEAYIKDRSRRLRELEDRLRGLSSLNHRQRELIQHALRHPGHRYTVESHRASHRVAVQTSRNDLADLAHRGLLRTEKVGHAVHYIPATHLEELLRDAPGKNPTPRPSAD